MKTKRRHGIALALMAALAAPLQAQPTGKKSITQDTYDIWKSIQGAALSSDGRWAIYTLTPVVGDGEVIVRATEGSVEYRAP